MGKRRNTSPSYHYIANKIKKLEEELKRAQRRGSRRSSTSSSSLSSNSSDSSSTSSSRPRSCCRPVLPSLPEPPYPEGVPTTSTRASNTELPRADAVPAAPLPSSSFPTAKPSCSTLADPLPSTSSVPDQNTPNPEDEAQVLNSELLQLLGDDPSQVKIYCDEIQPELAVRLQHIATKGLSNEARKELLDKYLLPANCTLIGAPTLNPETENAVPDTVLKRDKAIEFGQRRRASAVSCLATAMTSLMTSEPKNTAILQLLWDAVKLICDSQATDSSTRRNFVLKTLRKDLKDRLQSTNVDKMLFGEGLAETIKAANAISRTGADMKAVPVKQPTASKNKSAAHHLNWRAPAPMYRPKETNRSKEPATRHSYRSRHASSSKRSSQPAKNHSRR